MDDGATAGGRWARWARWDQGEHCSTPIGARTGMFEAGFGRSHGWRRPKCRVRRSVRPDEGGEGIREADGLPGERTFGLIFNKKRVFPKSLSPARRAGETPSRAMPRNAMRRLRSPPPRVFNPASHWPIVSPYSNNLCEQQYVYRRICPPSGHYPQGDQPLRTDGAAARTQAARQVLNMRHPQFR